jgi:hypothetical protein
MKNLQTFDEFLAESFDILNEAAGISNKDWDRMLDLVMKHDDGEKAAKLITDKNKAMYRFVTGLKLSNAPLNYNINWKSYDGYFNKLGNKAIELGATPEEIQNLYDATDVPTNYVEKMTKLAGKKLQNRFVGDISRAVIKEGCDIIYLPHNGYAITQEGKDAMDRNGRKWTIGYKTEIVINDTRYTFNFDAITDEGGGPTSYVVDVSSNPIFRSGHYGDKLGKNEFISELKATINKQKELK